VHTAELDWITPRAEEVIARHARVSTKNPDRAEFKKLISFCIKHGHWSVFEQASASFEILTTRAISPQILRHKTANFQELSQRYSNPWEVLEELEIDATDFSIRQQATSNRQSSSVEIPYEIQTQFRKQIQLLDKTARNLYEDMLDAGVARECARNILPLYTPSRLHMAAPIRTFVHYVGLRGQGDTQLEHRKIALSIGRQLQKLLPTITEALMEVEESSLRGWKSLRTL
tara:strand:+ start:1446 stop:2135 length:690 start_codon:yes stop_codon:yes gene_type:complete